MDAKRLVRTLEKAIEARKDIVNAIAELQEMGGDAYVEDMLLRAGKSAQQVCDFVEIAANAVASEHVDDESVGSAGEDPEMPVL